MNDKDTEYGPWKKKFAFLRVTMTDPAGVVVWIKFYYERRVTTNVGDLPFGGHNSVQRVANTLDMLRL